MDSAVWPSSSGENRLIDKLDLRVPGRAKVSRHFNRILQDCNREARPGDHVWRQSRYFERAGDFSSYGIPAVIHLNCTMTKDQHHKVEILQTGDKTFSEMMAICGEIFDHDPLSWGISRVDLTADVPNVPVQWFKEHTYVVAKQTTREMGVTRPLPYMAVRKGTAETIYAGVKPNQNRIYNKTAERMMQLKKENNRIIHQLRKKASEDLQMFEMPTLPTFEQRYGYPEDKVITRVERQCAGKDLEKLYLTNVERLKMSHCLRPFDKIKFFTGEHEDLSLERWGFTDWNTGMNLQSLRRDFGINEVRKIMMQAIPGRHWKRTWDKFQPFLRADPEVGITAMKLTSEYQDSTARQLAA